MTKGYFMIIALISVYTFKVIVSQYDMNKTMLFAHADRVLGSRVHTYARRVSCLPINISWIFGR